MADESAKGPEQASTWQRAVELNRQIDDVVATIERAVWCGHSQVPIHQPAPLRPPVPAPAASKPVLWPVSPTVPQRRNGFTTTNSRGDIEAPPPTPPARPASPLTLVETTASPPETPPTASNGEEDLAALAAELAAGLHDLRKQRDGMPDPATLTYALPWDAKPRPLFVKDEASEDWLPNPVGDDDIRDAVQPHWRVLYERAEGAEQAANSLGEAHRKLGILRHVGARRRALREARETAAAAAQAKRTADLLWAGEAMRQQFEHDRALATRIFEQAMQAAGGVARLLADIADLEAQEKLVTALREAGVTTVARQDGEGRRQALERALAEAAIAPAPAEDDRVGEAPPEDEGSAMQGARDA
ncbi:hypothetical protein [Azospirillum sp. sgz302134]